MQSPLLRLPGEIRNRIYKFVFYGENTTRNDLLETCKQIMHEAGPIYYSHVTLSFFDFADIKNRVKRTDPQLLSRVRSIRTSARPTQEMAWRIFLSTKSRSSYVKHASYLPELRYWHVYSYVYGEKNQQHVVKAIRQLMGRDVEVTFDT